MTPGETARVLTKIAAFDQRTIGDSDVLAWQEIIGHLDIDSCMIAVTTHYREHNTRAMPSDIRKLATDIRVRSRAESERRKRAIETAPDSDGRTGAAMIRHVLGRLKAAGQDVGAGQLLGKERASMIAEAAAEEWLDRTRDRPPTGRNGRETTACPTCYAPTTGTCTRCA